MTEWIVTSSALILVVIALRGLLKNKLRPMLRYAMWGLVLARLLLPFSLFESAVSLGNAVQPLMNRTETAVEQYEAAHDRVMQEHMLTGTPAAPSQTREEIRQQVYDDAYTSISHSYAQQGVTVPEQQLRQEAQTQAQVVDLVALAAELLPIIRYTGMTLMALALLVSNGWFARELLRSRKPLPCPDFPLPVYETAYTATPCLFGLIRPKVYLTPEAAQDPILRRHVLAHELTHFRHGDHIWSFLRGVCLILHWYNPLVWAAALLSRKDGELACDEATIRTLGEAERIAYGKTLIGMTCIRHDPKSFLVTATTMVSGKNTLKDRITAIARKPRNAFVAIVACVLVLAVAAGCTFTGAPSEPTEPTNPDDAVYEKLEAAAREINNREASHFRNYILPLSPSETDPEQFDYIEGWVSGDDMYTEQIHLGAVTPRFLCYGGNSYSHRGDNVWIPITGTSKDSVSYRVAIPSREHSMTWTETEDYLDVSFTEPDDPGFGTEIRLDTDGNLVWFATYLPAESIGADGAAQASRMYIVLIPQDTEPAEIRAHLDTVAPKLIADMEIYIPGSDTPTEPSTDSPVSLVGNYPFIYRDHPGWDYWREYIGPNDCVDGYLYVQDRTTMEITQILDTPVKDFTETLSHLFCVTLDGRIIQVDYAGQQQRTLYQATGEVSDIFAFSSTLFFNDGADLIKLDLDTTTAAVVGDFPYCESIYAVKEHWLWLKIDGAEYAYDTVTKELVRFRNYEEVNRFLEGTWPVHTTPEGMVTLPENCTLADVVSSYEENLSWKCSLGHTHNTPFSIPVIQPFSIAAVHCQDMIYAEWLPHLEYQRDQNTCPGYALVEYEAAINGELLSVVIHVLWDSGNHEYRVYNFDLFTGEYLPPAEMARRYLSISYADFIMAVSEYRMDQLQATQPNVDMREVMAEYSPDLAEMDEAALYLDKDGNLCLYYVYMDIAGAVFYPTVTPLPEDLEFSGTDAAYTWLFDMYESRICDDESRLYNYWSILHKVYGADIDEFEDQSHKLDDALMQSIWSFMFSDIPEKK